jgi:hypothetical protein
MADRLDEVFRAARQAPPDTGQREFGFETRLLARLRAERTTALPWAAMVWRLVPAFAAVVVALGVWAYASAPVATLDAALMAQGAGEFWIGE